MRFPFKMKTHHFINVHAINMIGAEHCHDVRIEIIDEIDILIDGVCRPLVPSFSRPHLRRDDGNKVVLDPTSNAPGLSQMFDQRLGFILDENVNGQHAGIDEITQHEVDDPILSSEGDRRLAPEGRQGH